MEDFLSIENFLIIFDVLYNYSYKYYKIKLKHNDVKHVMYKIMMKLYETAHKHNRTKKIANKIVIKTMINIIKNKHKKKFFDEEEFINNYNLLNDNYNNNDDNDDNDNKYELNNFDIKLSDILNKKLYDKKLNNVYNKEAPKQYRQDCIINEPKQYKEIIDIYLTIDSKDRNHDIDEPNNYKIYLPQEYNNVISIELISAEIPNTQYIINSFNNILHFQELNTQVLDNTTYEAIIPIGNYTISTLSTAIENALNIYGTSTYTVTNNLYKLETTPNLLSNGDVVFHSPNTLIGYEGYKAFDGNISTTEWKVSAPLPAILTYNFGIPKRITKYRFISSLVDSYPQDWTIDVSNDNITWYTVDIRNSIIVIQNVYSEFIINNPYTAQYIRINITTSSLIDIAISQLEFYSSSENKLTITSDLTGGDNIFNLIFDGGLKKYGINDSIHVFKNNSIGEILGFKYNNLTNSSSYTSQNIIKLYDEKYIYLYINDLNNIDTINGNYDNDKFVPILLDNEKGSIKYYKKRNKNNKINIYEKKLVTKNNNYKKIFVPPKSLNALTIQFKDYYGNYYDFNGFENSLFLKLELLNIKKNLEL